MIAAERQPYGAPLLTGGPDGDGLVLWDHQPGWCDGAAHKTLSRGAEPSGPPEPAAYWALGHNGWWFALCIGCTAGWRAEMDPPRVASLVPPGRIEAWRDYRRDWLETQQ